MDAVLQALADPSRRTVLEILRDHPATAGELADALPIARPGRVPAPAGAAGGRAGRRAPGGAAQDLQPAPGGPRRGRRVAGGATARSGRTGSMPCTRRSHEERRRRSEDHRHDASARRHPRSGARRGRLRHRHRRPVGGVHDAGAAGALDRRGVRRPARGWDGPRRLHQHLDRSGDGSRSATPRTTCSLTTQPGTDDETQLEAWLTAEGSRTRLVVEERGLPVGQLHFYGAGWQVHLEDLGRSLASGRLGARRAAGRSRRPPRPGTQRWTELTPAYEDTAVR